jgi:hypothetical protein
MTLRLTAPTPRRVDLEQFEVGLAALRSFVPNSGWLTTLYTREMARQITGTSMSCSVTAPLPVPADLLCQYGARSA